MILVTGATGLVGRAVVCRLASLGHDVVAMVRDAQAASGRLPSGIALRYAMQLTGPRIAADRKRRYRVWADGWPPDRKSVPQSRALVSSPMCWCPTA